MAGISDSFAEDINWDKLVESVIQVESSGNPSAYNEKSGAIGLMQITPIVLKEFNNFVKNIDNKKKIYWLNIGTADLLHTGNKAHYGWEKTDKKGWYLRVPKYKNSMELDLYSCPIEKKYLFNPKVNTFFGTWYLHRLQDHYKCKTIEQILMAYNAGITRCKRVNFNIKKLPKETQRYTGKVLKIYER